jgi:hypothetical protein
MMADDRVLIATLPAPNALVRDWMDENAASVHPVFTWQYDNQRAQLPKRNKTVREIASKYGRRC